MTTSREDEGNAQINMLHHSMPQQRQSVTTGDDSGGGTSPSSPVGEHDDPLLIAQTLTFVTDDGSVMMSFAAAPFSFAFKMNFFVVETVFVLLLLLAVPLAAHATVISISVGNLAAVAWFWYNSVRSVDITSDRGLNFWIGNFEVTVPYDKIVSVKHIRSRLPCNILSCGLIPHRGYMSNPSDGVAVLTSMPSTPFWTWPRSLEGGRERICCCGLFRCPRLILVFSPAGGGLNFLREVENEITRQESGGRNKNLEGGLQHPSSGGPPMTAISVS